MQKHNKMKKSEWLIDIGLLLYTYMLPVKNALISGQIMRPTILYQQLKVSIYRQAYYYNYKNIDNSK